MKQKFVSRLVMIYRNFRRLSPRLRCFIFETAIYEAALRVRVPAPTIVWGRGGGWFFGERWQIQISLNAVSRDPYVQPVRAWLYTAAQMYHELYHVEMAFRAIQSMLAGAVKIPEYSKPHLTANLTNRAYALYELGFPMKIIGQAARTRNAQPLDVGEAQRWVNANYYGGDARRTAHENIDKGGAHWKPYLALWDERKAIDLQREISVMFRAVIHERDTDMACEGLSTLFSE